MNALTQWDPFKEMDELQNRISSLFGKSDGQGRDGPEESITSSEWAPLVDIIEDDKEYLVKAELPEVQREDVRVSVDNGMLTIRGERRIEKEEKNKRFHRLERGYGSFVRSFLLPDIAEASTVTAELKDGILRVHLPKSGKSTKKHIEVKVG